MSNTPNIAHTPNTAAQLDWRELAQPEALLRWMDRQQLGSGPIEDPVVLTGGTQNLLLRFTRAGRAYVLRRPPLHGLTPSAHDMAREYRVVAALAGMALGDATGRGRR